MQKESFSTSAEQKLEEAKIAVGARDLFGAVRAAEILEKLQAAYAQRKVTVDQALLQKFLELKKEVDELIANFENKFDDALTELESSVQGYATVGLRIPKKMDELAEQAGTLALIKQKYGSKIDPANRSAFDNRMTALIARIQALSPDQNTANQPQSTEKNIDLTSWDEAEHPQVAKQLEQSKDDLEGKLAATPPTSLEDIQDSIDALFQDRKSFDRQISDLDHGVLSKYTNKVEVLMYLETRYLSPTDAVLQSAKQRWMGEIKAIVGPAGNTLSDLSSMDTSSFDIPTLQAHIAEYQATVASVENRLASLSPPSSLGAEQNEVRQLIDAAKAKIAEREVVLKSRQEVEQYEAWKTNITSQAWHATFVGFVSADIEGMNRASLESLLNNYPAVQAAVDTNIQAIYAAASDRQKQLLDDIKSKLSEKRTQIARKLHEVIHQEPIPPQNMTLAEIVDELGKVVVTGKTERTEQVIEAYYLKRGEEKDLIRYSRNQLIVYLAKAESAGDTDDAKDWSTVYAKVVEQFSKGLPYNEMYVGLYVEARQDVNPVTNELEKNTLEGVRDNKNKVNSRAIDVHDYIVKRLRDVHGGITRAVTELPGGQYQDATNGYIPQGAGEADSDYQDRLKAIFDLDKRGHTYSYNTIGASDVQKRFEEHLKLVFADLHAQDPERLDLLVRFNKLTARTEAFIPYLMRNVTRRHGRTAGEFKDEARFMNPFALSMYNTARYAGFEPGRYMERFMYVDREQFLEIVEGFTPRNSEKAALVYDTISAYLVARWGEIPKWMLEVRKLFGWQDGQNIAGESELRLDGTIFPTIPELVNNVARLELQKQDLIERHDSGQTSDADFIKEATELFFHYYKRGYGGKPDWIQDSPVSVQKAKDALAKIGKIKLLDSEINSSIYVGSADSMELMMTFFDKNFESMSADAAEEKMLAFLRKIIGQAKLIPGDHHLLFAPLACDLVIQLSNAVYRHNKLAGVRFYRDSVKTAYARLVEACHIADGIPEYTRAEIKRLMFIPTAFTKMRAVFTGGPPKLPEGAPEFLHFLDSKPQTTMPDSAVEDVRSVELRIYNSYFQKLQHFANLHSWEALQDRAASSLRTGVLNARDLYISPYKINEEKKADTTQEK